MKGSLAGSQSPIDRKGCVSGFKGLRLGSVPECGTQGWICTSLFRLMTVDPNHINVHKALLYYLHYCVHDS